MARQYLLPYNDKVDEIELEPYPELKLHYISEEKGVITLQSGDQTITLGNTRVNKVQCLLSHDKKSRYCFRSLRKTTDGVLFSLTHLSLVRPADEFFRYSRCIQMKSAISNDLPKNQQYETENILERWLIALANDKRSGDLDPIFSLEKLASSYPATAKMAKEMKEKAIANFSSRLNKVLTLGYEFVNSISGVHYIPGTSVYPTPYATEDAVYFGGIKIPISPNRLKLLLSLNDSVQELGYMVLRYACLLPRGQQWSVPRPVYKYLVEKHYLQVEGFASPFNSQIIALQQPEDRLLYFCSIFLDTDITYGSLGNFFDQRFKNTTVLANPPFVEDILERTTTKVLDSLDKSSSSPLTFFVVTPAWRDASFHKRLLESVHFKQLIALRRGKYHYVDQETNRVTAPFESHFFVLSSTDKDFSSLETEIPKLFAE